MEHQLCFDASCLCVFLQRSLGYALDAALRRVPELCLVSSVVYAASGCTVLSLLFWERHKAELHISSATPCEHDTVALVVPVALLELSD